MLILTRRVNETIYIGDAITVTVVGVDQRTGQVRIGIEAPKHIPVHREEIHRRIAAQVPDDDDGRSA